MQICYVNARDVRITNISDHDISVFVGSGGPAHRQLNA